jgi:hypothetical protein
MADVNNPIDYMLTTVDNPYNPFTQWDDWYAYDSRMGYNTPGLLDRIAKTSDELSDPDQALAIQDAIDEICEINVSGMHRKVSREFFETET